MKIAVIGTGYVGLVTGACLAEVGHEVVCVDIDKSKIAALNKGKVPIYEPGLAELVVKNQAGSRLSFTADLAKIGSPEAIFFALPTPPNGDGEADLSFVLKAAGDVAKLIKDYTVLVNKSTVPVGTTRKVAKLISGITKVRCDVVSNPEFLQEGLAVDGFMHPDRIVVGSVSPKALEVMRKVYAPFTKSGAQLITMDEESSEMTKYSANSFLATKISFMNEIANLCELTGASVDQVKKGIGADERIGSRFLNAGIGYGGSCFPKDVMALEKIAHRHDYDFKILRAVMDVNARQKQVLVDKVTAWYGQNLAGLTLAVWGLAFKPDTDDVREAPALEIIRELVGRGATVHAYDPQAAGNARRVLNDTVTYSRSAEDALKASNALIIATEWKEFAVFDLSRLANLLKDKVVFDGRNIFELDAMKLAGLKYISIGRKAV